MRVGVRWVKEVKYKYKYIKWESGGVGELGERGSRKGKQQQYSICQIVTVAPAKSFILFHFILNYITLTSSMLLLLFVGILFVVAVFWHFAQHLLFPSNNSRKKKYRNKLMTSGFGCYSVKQTSMSPPMMFLIQSILCSTPPLATLYYI